MQYKTITYPRLYMSFTLLIFAVFGLACANDFVDSNQLSPELQASYAEITQSLNNWFGSYEESEAINQDIEKFVLTSPDFIPIHLAKVKYAIKAGYRSNLNATYVNNNALSELKKLEARAPDFGPIYVLKAHLLTSLGQIDEADIALDKAASLGSKTVMYHLNLANLLIARAQYKAAVSSTYTALSADKLAINELIVATHILANNSRYIDPEINLVDLIFTHLSQPDDRLQMARLLSRYHSGNQFVSSLAYEIINEEKNRHPDIKRNDLELANLILVDGYKYSANNVDYYSESSIEQVEPLLNPLVSEDELKDRAYDWLIVIAFSKKDHESVKTLISQAKVNNANVLMLGKHEAKLHYLNREYDVAIEILENLALKDVAIRHDKLISAAYAKLGDTKKLETVHLNEISQYPENAWAYGNYTTFLVTQAKDTKKAIEIGEQGMAISSYPLLRKYLGLAYHIEGSKLLMNSTGDYKENRKLAAGLFSRSLELNDIDYSKETFCTHCTYIDVVKSVIENANKPPEPEKIDYVKYIQFGVIGLLVILIFIRLLSKGRKK